MTRYLTNGANSSEFADLVQEQAQSKQNVVKSNEKGPGPGKSTGICLLISKKLISTGRSQLEFLLWGREVVLVRAGRCAKFSASKAYTRMGSWL